MTKEKKNSVPCNQHVIPYSGKGWAVTDVVLEGVTKTFNTQKEAIEYAKPIARNNKSKLFIHAKTGKIRRLHNYLKLLTNNDEKTSN